MVREKVWLTLNRLWLVKVVAHLPDGSQSGVIGTLRLLNDFGPILQDAPLLRDGGNSLQDMLQCQAVTAAHVHDQRPLFMGPVGRSAGLCLLRLLAQPAEVIHARWSSVLRRDGVFTLHGASKDSLSLRIHRHHLPHVHFRVAPGKREWVVGRAGRLPCAVPGKVLGPMDVAAQTVLEQDAEKVAGRVAVEEDARRSRVRDVAGRGLYQAARSDEHAAYASYRKL